MKIKTADLTGIALDWAVARADGWADAPNYFDIPTLARGAERKYRHQLAYTTDWAHGGPIIEREGIGLTSEARDGSVWKAQLTYAREVLLRLPPRLVYTYCLSRGPTALVAAMRCFVLSKIGDYVDIPDSIMVPE